MAKRYRFRFKRMDVYGAAVEHFGWCVGVVGGMPRGPFVVTDQVLGASLSIMGNVGEANGREKKPGEVEQHYRYAQGSTFESATHLDALSALGAIDDDAYNRQEETLARIATMLTRLIQRQQKARRQAVRRARAGTSAAPEGQDKRGGPAEPEP